MYACKSSLWFVSRKIDSSFVTYIFINVGRETEDDGFGLLGWLMEEGIG